MNRTLLPMTSALALLVLAGGNAARAADAAARGAITPAALATETDSKGPAISHRHASVTGKRPLVAASHTAIARAETATMAAMREPRRDNYVNAVQVYPWWEGALYQLYTAPERVSDVALQPGETLISVAAGDTVRWVIGDTTSGSGAGRQTHILVKPSSAGLATNLVITTDRRVYRVEVKSYVKGSMSGIAWIYPQDTLLALKRADAAAEAARPVAEGIPVEALNFGYVIEGDQPIWRPIRAFDDGRQVFIQFPASLGQGEAPPLFVVGDGGRAELVNYRVSGRYYVVDRLFAAAELRLGERRQQVVRIVRADGRRQRRARP